jgi:uncharacterized protein YkwD
MSPIRPNPRLSPADKREQDNDIKDLCMRYRAWGAQLPYYLLLGSILLFLPCSSAVAQGCCSTTPLSQRDITSFVPSPGLEQELLLLTNHHRILNGLPELTLDKALTQIAREHSTGMANQGFISHNLPSGDLRSRINRAGYPIEIARENVASAPTIRMAQSALTDSPDHERNILAADVTRVGIGIAHCPDPLSKQLYITEIFATPREEYQPERVQEMLVSRVNELRQNGAGSMILDPELERMASRSLQSISLPYKKEELQDALSTSTKELGNDEKMELAKVQANVQLVYNPNKINISSHAPEGQARSYGAAVRQVTDSQNQSAFLVLTLIGISR